MNRSFRTSMAVALFALLGTSTAFAQSGCADYHKSNCDRSTDARFSVNGQSRSAAVKVGEETELNIIIYRSQDYRISVCHDERILGEQIAIRLIEKVRVPKKGSDPKNMEYVEEEKV
ncbi:MAG TPA: hypothetical protein PK760_05540, partial [Flavobacteriales bacterium]|nr:hypothetical protein [Flavobacteriales bacterium]